MSTRSINMTSCHTLLRRFAHDRLGLPKATQTALFKDHPPSAICLANSCWSHRRASLSTHCFLHRVCSSSNFCTVSDRSTGGSELSTRGVFPYREGIVCSTLDQPSSDSDMIRFGWYGLRDLRDECGMFGLSLDKVCLFLSIFLNPCDAPRIPPRRRTKSYRDLFHINNMILIRFRSSAKQRAT